MFGKKIIKVWTLDEIKVSYSFIILFGVSTLLTSFGSIYSTIIFGIGARWNIVIFSLFQAIVNIVVSLVAIKYFKLGNNGVILGTCLSMFTNMFVLPRILNKMIIKYEKKD